MPGLKLPFLRDISYNQKLEAQALVNRGIDDKLLYFWFNCRENNYPNKQSALYDADKLKIKHTNFEKDINQWANGVTF